jgi:hypothetical protein
MICPPLFFDAVGEPSSILTWEDFFRYKLFIPPAELVVFCAQATTKKAAVARQP